MVEVWREGDEGASPPGVVKVEDDVAPPARGYAYKADGVGIEDDGGEEVEVEVEEAAAVVEEKGPPKRDEEVEAWEGRAEGRILNGLKDHVDVAEEGLCL